VLGAFDWVKNCSSIADFYQSMEKPRHCALALSSAQKILSEKVMAKIKASTTPEEMDVTEQDVLELEAEINKKWARLDVKVLKLAFEFQMAKRHAFESGEVLEDPIIEEDDDGEGLPSVPLAKPAVGPTSDLVVEDVGDTNGDSTEKTAPVPPSVPASALVSVSSSSLQSSIFSGCVVNETPFLRFGEVTSFETARILYLRANSRIEEAKKKYVLDGEFDSIVHCGARYCSLLLAVYHSYHLHHPWRNTSDLHALRRIFLLTSCCLC
jgi:KIF-1 binding protein C terminal